MPFMKRLQSLAADTLFVNQVHQNPSRKELLSNGLINSFFIEHVPTRHTKNMACINYRCMPLICYQYIDFDTTRKCNIGTIVELDIIHWLDHSQM